MVRNEDNIPDFDTSFLDEESDDSEYSYSYYTYTYTYSTIYSEEEESQNETISSKHDSYSNSYYDEFTYSSISYFTSNEK